MRRHVRKAPELKKPLKPGALQKAQPGIENFHAAFDHLNYRLPNCDCEKCKKLKELGKLK